MTTIKNIVFDLGGVIVDLDIERCIAAFEALGMHAVAKIISPYYPADILGKLERGDLSAHEVCEEMRRMSGHPDITDEQIAQAYGAFLVGLPIDRLRMIDELRRRGLRTYVLSNNNPFAMRFIYEMFRIDGKCMDDYFDKIYLSHEMHELKPSPEIFRKMIADSGMHPEETLFIDDGQRNIDTACELGFKTHLALPGVDFSPIFETL